MTRREYFYCASCDERVTEVDGKAHGCKPPRQFFRGDLKSVILYPDVPQLYVEPDDQVMMGPILTNPTQQELEAAVYAALGIDGPVEFSVLPNLTSTHAGARE